MIVKKEHGYGLIETLIAIGIFLIASSAIYSQLRTLSLIDGNLTNSWEELIDQIEERRITKANLNALGKSSNCKNEAENNYQLISSCKLKNNESPIKIKIYKE